MCWNQHISLNTFLFSCFALLFIYVTNRFTKYKSKNFENPLVFLYLLEIAVIQLIEFFLWRNLKNKSMNELLSKIASFIVTIQPFTVMLMISNSTIKYSLLFVYVLFILFYLEYKRLYNPIQFHTSVGKNGHLSWEWMNFTGYENIFYVFHLLLHILALLLINNSVLSLFIIISLIISMITNFKYNTFGTIWCWTTNFLLLYFIIDILIIQPYYEYNGLC